MTQARDAIAAVLDNKSLADMCSAGAAAGSARKPRAAGR